MKTTFKLVAFLLTITLLSCNANLNLNDGVEGSGNVITEKRTINESFDKISASTGVTVIVEQGSPTDVEVETDDNLMQYVITKVENGTLIVPLDASPWWLGLRQVKGLRFDLDNASACRAFSVENISLYRRE